MPRAGATMTAVSRPLQSVLAPILVTWLACAPLPGCKRQAPLDQRVRDRIHAKLPTAEVVVEDPATLVVTIRGTKVTLSLDNVAVVCKDEPNRCDATIDRLVESLATIERTAKPPVASELRVVVHSRKTVEDYRKSLAPEAAAGADRLVTFPFLGDMTTVLVRDLPDGLAWVNRSELGAMDLDAERARAAGMANLEAAVRTLPAEPVTAGVFRIRAGDSYEAARVLLPKLWDGLAKQVRGDLVVVAPTRDVVFAAGSGDPPALAAMEALAKKAFDTGPYALSTTVLRRTDAGFVVAGPNGR